MSFDKDSLMLESIYEVLTEAPHITFGIQNRSVHFDLRCEDDMQLSKEQRLPSLEKRIREFVAPYEDQKSIYNALFGELSQYMNIDLFIKKVYGIPFSGLAAKFGVRAEPINPTL